MATPLGHVGVGCAWALLCSRRPVRARWLAVGAACAAAADLDFLPGLLVGEPARFHHGASHSIVAMLAASSLVLAAWWRYTVPGRRAIALVGGAFLSHLGADLVTHDPGAASGLPLAWPFVPDRFACGVWLVPAVSRAWPMTPAWLAHTAWLVLTEAAIVLPLVVGAWIHAGRPGALHARWGKGATPV